MKSNLEDNKMIAKFMGVKDEDMWWYSGKEKLWFGDDMYPKIIDYIDYEWSMPVIDKLEEAGYQFCIDGKKVTVSFHRELLSVEEKTKRESIYRSLVTLIKDLDDSVST